MKRLLSFSFCAILAAGCTTYPVVGRFADHNEVFIGTVDHNLMNGTSFIQAKTKSGVTCTGSSRVTYIPVASKLATAFAIPYCTGQRGDARLRCSNGRVVGADWEAETCTSGSGYGFDTDGNKFEFAFGMSEAEAKARFEKASAEVAEKPAAEGYGPKEARQKVGFSAGTGFFVSAQGHLVTNFHVIDGARELNVMRAGKAIPARIVASDPVNDIAVLKIDGDTRPLPVEFGGGVRRAEEVFTLGYPQIDMQGQAQKATFGRINALTGGDDDVRFLQIDVPIQPGNSGGPLIGPRGQVVGVVTKTLNPAYMLKQGRGVPQNVNYAVKAAYLAPLLADIPTLQPASATRSNAEWAADYEESVVLIIAQ